MLEFGREEVLHIFSAIGSSYAFFDFEGNGVKFKFSQVVCEVHGKGADLLRLLKRMTSDLYSQIFQKSALKGRVHLRSAKAKSSCSLSVRNYFSKTKNFRQTKFTIAEEMTKER